MSSHIVVWVVSKPRMAELQSKPGGLTWAADKLIGKEGPLPEGILRCRLGASDLVDSDKRYVERARRAIEMVLAVTPESSSGGRLFSKALEFYCPLLPGPDAVDDTGREEGFWGPVLAPERCRQL